MAIAENRTEKLDLRLSREAKLRLRAAAVQSHRSLSEFVLESALARAEEFLPDRRAFGLDDERWSAFEAALERPVRPLPRMQKLLSKAGPFDRADS